jgi:hypothetical protein
MPHVRWNLLMADDPGQPSTQNAVAAEDLAAGCHGGCCHNSTGAAGTIALAVVTVRLSIGNGNTRIGCASLIAVAGCHT